MSFHILLLDRAGNNLVNADFFPYSRMFFAVKYIYLTLYIVHTYRVASTYGVPMYLLALLAVRAARSARCGRRTSGRLPAPARVGARVAALASVVRVILFAYNVHSPPLCPACPPRFRPAANFFEIVFGLSISVQLSLTGIRGTD